MIKKLFVIVVVSVLMVPTLSCKEETKEGAASDIEGESVIKEGGVAEYEKTEFDEVVEIFKGFERIVEQNKTRPAAGAKACQEYAQNNIPKIKALEGQIKKYETNSKYINQLMDTNNRIREISDRVSKIVNESYGLQGADVLLQLSDMALARL